jgi:adenylate cyclase
MTTKPVWTLTLRSPDGKPREFILKPGKNTIGRGAENDIVVSEISASRYHAEIEYDPDTNEVTIRDLESLNGTFVNREMLTDSCQLHHNDVIRIGLSVIHVTDPNLVKQTDPRDMGTRPLTRDFLLESLDHHAVLLYEVSRKMNTILDIDTALQEVSTMMQRTMGADKCNVILADQFPNLTELGFPTTIAKLAIEQQAAVITPEVPVEQGQLGLSAALLRVRSALCVPILASEEVLGLIYMYKTDPGGRPFDQRDLQLSVAISHQAALTIQRMQLLERIQEESRVRQLLERFVSPAEADYIFQSFKHTGHLTDLAERTVTVLFADIVDSTGLAEQMKPKRFGEMLNRYYQYMTDIIFEYDGLVDKYLGDGVMAVFGMNENKPDPEGRAVNAGLKMIERAKKMREEELDQIHIGVGINSGPVVAGYVRTKQRVEFAVLGDTVNVASGLQGKARPDRLFIGPATAAAVVGRFATQRIGAIPVKGRMRDIQAHEVLHESFE